MYIIYLISYILQKQNTFVFFNRYIKIIKKSKKIITKNIITLIIFSYLFI